MNSKGNDAGNIRLALEERSFYRLSMLASRINRCLSGAYIAKFGRPANGWKIVTILGRFGPMTMTELTEHTTLEIDKITRTVDALAEQGLAERRTDSSDRRRVMASLTTKGKKAATELEKMIAVMEREFLVTVSSRDRDVFYRVLDELQARANQLFSGTRPWKRFV